MTTSNRFIYNWAKTTRNKLLRPLELSYHAIDLYSIYVISILRISTFMQWFLWNKTETTLILYTKCSSFSNFLTCTVALID